MRYLLLTYYHQASGKIDEGMTLSNNIRRKDSQTASVILDFKEQRVVKASIRDTSIPKDWDRIVSYYYPFYTAIMERLFKENGHDMPTAQEVDQKFNA
jgi:hypothetical protein